MTLTDALSKTVLRPRDSIMLYADTGGGKTTLAGELALHVRKVAGLKTFYNTADRGGYDPLVPLVEAGYVDVQTYEESDPWTWLNHVAAGERLVNGKWTPLDLSPYGLMVFELGTSLPDTLLMDLARQTAAGLGTGGEATFILTTKDGKIGTNNRTHYNLVQTAMRDAMWVSQRLPVPVLWTAAVRRGEDDVNAIIIGPQIAGSAMSASIPRWFKFTFQISVDPNTRVHTLHLDTHKDGMTKAFANSRVPLWGTTTVPPTITPASLVKALGLIRQRQSEALAFVQKEVG